MITKEQALALRHGSIIHLGECTVTEGPRGGKTYRTEQWRVSGKVQTWKRQPDAFRVAIKHGLYTNGYLDNNSAVEFHLAEECRHTELQAKAIPELHNRNVNVEAKQHATEEFSDSREEPYGPAYPTTNRLIKDAGENHGDKTIAAIIAVVAEYEHGTAEVKDVHKSLTLPMYAAVALDLILSIKNGD